MSCFTRGCRLRFGLAIVFWGPVIGCGESNPGGDVVDARVPDDRGADAAVLGPPISGIIRNSSGAPLSEITFQLTYDGGVVDITTSNTGTFSDNLPFVGMDYQVHIDSSDGYWGLSAWLLDVREDGATNLMYTVADDAFVNGLNDVLGIPTIEKTGGFVSLSVFFGARSQSGLGFSLSSPADPIFTINETTGMPVKSPTFLNTSSSSLFFANVSPQILPPVSPNAEAFGCRQLSPASEVRAGTVLLLTASCD